jgi:2,4-dienoyl-CoA reductase-like NADH-dependent reductase (Old Yellow Enzyme family)/thioredoxin reductase
MTTPDAFESLFQPVLVGSVRLKNRLVVPPMGTQFADPSGAVTDRLIAYLVERARGEFGLVIPGYAFIEESTGRGMANQIGAHNDHMIPGLNRLAEALQAEGARTFLQLCHTGRQADPAMVERGQPVAPSPVPMGKDGVVPRELTLAEIEDIIEAFGQAARRARDAGFDGVELHGAHGYLLCQFMSEYTNRRTDKYGGSFHERMTFPLEVLERVRHYVGPDYPAGFRISGDEYLSLKGPEWAGRGITVDDGRLIAQTLAGAGADFIHVSAATAETVLAAAQPAYYPRCFEVPLAAGIKQVVDVPVVAVGAITSPEDAAGIVEEGKADLVALGRPSIADPHLPRKLREGRRAEVRRCIMCNMCNQRVSVSRMLACSVNPSVGREGEAGLGLASTPKRILVVGGGPAGMEAARVAAARGYRVTLWEREEELGGNLLPASKLPFKEEMGDLAAYYAGELERLGVDVRLETEATGDDVQEFQADEVVVAIGADPIRPEWVGPGDGRVAQAADVLLGRIAAEEHVVIAGGGVVGCDTALFLARQGHRVTIVEEGEDVALDEEAVLNRLGLKEKLVEEGIAVRTNLRITGLFQEGLVAVDRGWEQHRVLADLVVLALGFEPRRDLSEGLEAVGMRAWTLGDCVEPRCVYDAIHEGYRVGSSL